MLIRVVCCDATTQVALGHLNVEVSRTHVIRLTQPETLPWTSDRLDAEVSTYTVQKTTSIPKGGIENAIPAVERHQIYSVLDRRGTGTDDMRRNYCKNHLSGETVKTRFTMVHPEAQTVCYSQTFVPNVPSESIFNAHCSDIFNFFFLMFAIPKCLTHIWIYNSSVKHNKF